MVAKHEAQHHEDQLALQEKEKRILELEEALHTRIQMEEQKKVGVALAFWRGWLCRTSMDFCMMLLLVSLLLFPFHSGGVHCHAREGEEVCMNSDH